MFELAEIIDSALRWGCTVLMTISVAETFSQIGCCRESLYRLGLVMVGVALIWLPRALRDVASGR